MKINKLSQAIIAIVAGVSASAAYSQDGAGESPEEIVVQGFRASLAKAADKKREADTIQDSIVAEDLGKMPDQNVAESLQRITGVSISRAGGEGSKVTIRGFGPQFNVVKMNDRTLATTGSDRSFDFAVLPSELISGADVVKSPTARLASGSIGGFVNLHSARPLDNPGFHASGSLNAKYQDINEKFNPEFSGVVSDTFVDDTVGVLLGVSYKDTDNRIDNYTGGLWNEFGGHYSSGKPGYGFPMDKSKVLDENGKPTALAGARGPGRLRYAMNLENRERIGANASIQWAPNENFKSTVDVLYSKLTFASEGSGLQVASQEDWYTAASVDSKTGTIRTATQSGDLEYLLTTDDSDNVTKAFGYNLEYTEGGLTLTGDVSYSKASGDRKFDSSTAHRFTHYNANGSVGVGLIAMDFTKGDVPDLSLTGFNIADASTVRLHWQDMSGSNSHDEVKEAKFDAKYEIDSSFIKSFESGIAYSKRELSTIDTGVKFAPPSGYPGGIMYFGNGTSDPYNDFRVDPSVLKVGPSNYMDGLGGNFPRQWVTPTSGQAFRDSTQAWLVAHASENVWGSPRDLATKNPKGTWEYLYPSPGNIVTQEITEAAYVQANLGGDIGEKSWSGNLGVRYVTTDNESSGLNTTIGELKLLQAKPSIHNGAVQTSAFSTVESSDHYYLPSANFSLNLEDGNYVRVGMAKSITRPSLSDSSATFTQTAGLASPSVSITGSNPHLRPYQVKSFDLSFEHYGENGTSYSAGYFYKDITSFISSLTTYGVWDGPVEQALLNAYAAEGVKNITSITTGPQNRKGGKVQGLEVGVLHNFDNLPGIWSGLGIQANYTYSTSKDRDAAPITSPAVPTPDSGLEGFAKNSYNVTGFYDKDGVELRLAYNYRGQFMNSRSGDGIAPEYTDTYGQLDFSASYDISENFTATLEVNNLTNEIPVKYLGERDRVSYVEMTGARYQLGLRAKF